MLDHYEAELRKWNRAINLVSPQTLSSIWQRHILDSGQLDAQIPTKAKTVVDLGSGAGLPGIVLAILSVEKHPNRTHVLIESDQRKCAFLTKISADLPVNTKIYARRIEDVSPLRAEVVTSRALARLTKLLSFGAHHLSEDGICLFLKGEKAEEEISEASKTWSFSCKKIESITERSSAILQIGEIRRIGLEDDQIT
jgi:16S rRNA (guanine527-N7)-methyltransferase